MPYTLQVPTQLREHLRALRKQRGLTQAALGELIGVGQARVAEIENNPGVVSLDQLMKLLSALGVSLQLSDGSDALAAAPPAGQRPPPAASDAPAAARSTAQAPAHDGPNGHFVFRPKKGSW